MHHCSSLSRRRMANSDWSKITGNSMNRQYTIHICYPSSRISFNKLKTLGSSPNLTYVGGITTYASKKGTNGKRRLKRALEISNLVSCIFVTFPWSWLLYDYDMTEVNGHMKLLTDPWLIYDDVLLTNIWILVVVVLGSDWFLIL